METNAQPLTTDELLEHANWLRGLARSLVQSDDAAEDLVQETWLRALRSGPKNMGATRGWLRTVIRNLARERFRSTGRAGDRERRAGRSEAQPPSSEAAERVELQRVLAENVGQLPELQRTVIALRYFDGLGVREIGRRLDLSPRTVETRLARGLQLLRQRLDAQHGGDRSAWLAGMAGVAWTGTQVGVTGVAVGVGVVAASVVGVYLWFGSTSTPATNAGAGASEVAALTVLEPESPGSRDSVQGPRPTGHGAASRVPASAPPAGRTAFTIVAADTEEPLAGVACELADLSSGTTFGLLSDETGSVEVPWTAGWARARLSVAATETTQSALFLPREGGAATFEVPRRGGHLSGRVVDLDGQPVPYADVRLWRTSPTRPVLWETPQRRVEADAAGRFAFGDLAGERGETNSIALGASAPGLQSWTSAGGRIGRSSVETCTLYLGPAHKIEGRVREVGGAPVPGARLLAYTRGSGWKPPKQKGRVEAHRAPIKLEVHSKADGTFELPASAERLHLQIDHDLHPRWMRWVEPSEEYLDIRLERGGHLAGQITDPAGAPLPGVNVQLWSKDTREPQVTDADGCYSFVNLTPLEGALVAFHGGGRALHVEAVDLPSSGTVRVDSELGPALALAGSVLDAEGQPCAGLAVEVRGERLFHSSWYPRHRAMTWEQRALPHLTHTRSEGEFSFDGLYAGQFRITVRDPSTREVVASALNPAGATDLVLPLGSGLDELLTVELRATLAGNPVRSAHVLATPYLEPESPAAWGVVSSTLESAAGLFEIRGLEPGVWSFSITDREAMRPGAPATWGSAPEVLGPGTRSFDAALTPPTPR